MSNREVHELRYKVFLFFVSFFSVFLIAQSVVYADVTINILAVNGTDDEKEKEVTYYLPKELSQDDILDTAGLDLQYDVNKAEFFVHKNLTLAPKETKTFKVRVRDIWTIDEEKVENIKEQIDASAERMKGSEYEDLAAVKKESLHKRIDFILEESEKFSGNVEKRIDRYRIYAGELDSIRKNAVSVSYWRSKPPALEEGKTVRFIVEVENPFEEEFKTDQSHYLPKEVKPEHFVDTQGFDIRYDIDRKQIYLTKEETLKAREKKRYTFEIIDIWRIAQIEIENLKDRAREAYRLLEKSEYKASAEYLIKSIKENLEEIEISQAIQRPINEHISAYRENLKRYEKAKNDVDALEDLLKALREELERSKLKNVMQQIKSLKSIADISRSIFKKPEPNTAWKIIAAIVSTVILLTVIYFAIWSKRSKAAKLEERKEEETKKE